MTRKVMKLLNRNRVLKGCRVCGAREANIIEALGNVGMDASFRDHWLHKLQSILIRELS